MRWWTRRLPRYGRDMIKAVFDTVVFVRSLINPHGRWGELIFKCHDSYELFVSKPIVEEILEGLHRPELGKKFRMERDLDFEKIIEILGQAPYVEIVEEAFVSRDPKDNKFVATAEVARADFLVTEDEDLLVLGEYRGTKIINALEFLGVLRDQG